MDIEELFAPPTEAEFRAVEAEWAGRDITPDESGIVVKEEFTAGSWTGSMQVVWHRIDDVTHYGAIIAPADDRPRPVLLYLHGGDGGVSVNEIKLVYEAVPALRDEFVLVVPSFRSEPLYAGGQTYRSGGAPSPFDGDVDDTLALLNLALSLVDQADPERIAAIGFSRGATVAMMAAVRDPRIDAVVEFFGITDFFGEFVQELAVNALRGDLAPLPAVDDLDSEIIQPLKTSRLAIAAARQALLIRSPLRFAERLPALQIHHGLMDPIIPSSEAEAMIQAMQKLGGNFEPYLYPKGMHHPITMDGSLDRTVQFLLRVTQPLPA